MNAGLLPIKGPEHAKRRLAAELDGGVHRELIEALIEDALEFCVRTDGISWWVISDDEAIRALAEARGLAAVADSGVGLNEAVRTGLAAVAARGANSVLVIPGDVPLVRPEDADDILDTGAFSDVVVVSASDGGTNGLYLDLPTEMEPRFGPDSLRAHVEAAEQLGLRCSILDLPRLAVDLDTPEDARVLLESGEGGGATLEVLRHLYG
jgi:2-phospho-L-lactate guanylyltransferase